MNMKRLYRIFILFAAICLVTAGADAKTIFAVSVFKSVAIQNSDTLDSNTLLRVYPIMVDIIAPSSGVQFYRDGIVFLSNSRSEVRMLESHTSFGKIEAYYATYQDTSVGIHRIFSPSFSWEVPCEAMTFNSDYSVMFYTKLPSKKEPEKIYQAKYLLYRNKKYEWVSDDKPLSFCSDGSIYSHPALSADGQQMVFASNRKESIGGLDLFITHREGSDWSSPTNLGNLINTQGNEQYPFLDQDNNLYFSSDGIKGFGGYDIYICLYNGRGWEKPVNLTQKINSRDDDIAFTMSRLDGKSAFFTSKSTAENRTLQLFSITFRDQSAISKLTNLSNAFKYIAEAKLSSSETVVPAAKRSVATRQAEKVQAGEPVKPEKLPEIKQEPAAPPVEEPVITDDAIIYRVQFLSVSKPKGSYELNIGGKIYETFEYLFNGAYRSCVGEFSNQIPAINLQNLLKREGYPDAFVVAFRNNERLTGSLLSLAKSQEQPGLKPSTEAAQSRKTSEISQKPAGPPVEEVSTASDAVIYRVQFLTTPKSKGSYEISAGGKTYKTFEYLYNGAYRSCAGEFNSRTPAINLQNVLKREGYPDAFVVAFKNNVRLTDPALFR